jgi:hypothetical protein
LQETDRLFSLSDRFEFEVVGLSRIGLGRSVRSTTRARLSAPARHLQAKRPAWMFLR